MNIFYWAESIMLYLLIGAVFSGITNRAGMWSQGPEQGYDKDFMTPLLGWPIFVTILLCGAILYVVITPFVIVAETIARKKEVSEEILEGEVRLRHTHDAY
jgi:hypothetical protein